MESILSSKPVRTPDASLSGLTGPAIASALGFTAALLGVICVLAASGPPQGTGEEETVLTVGRIALVIGIPTFIISILVEFFAMGSCLRRIAASLESPRDDPGNKTLKF